MIVLTIWLEKKWRYLFESPVFILSNLRCLQHLLKPLGSPLALRWKTAPRWDTKKPARSKAVSTPPTCSAEAAAQSPCARKTKGRCLSQEGFIQRTLLSQLPCPHPAPSGAASVEFWPRREVNGRRSSRISTPTKARLTAPSAGSPTGSSTTSSPSLVLVRTVGWGMAGGSPLQATAGEDSGNSMHPEPIILLTFPRMLQCTGPPRSTPWGVWVKEPISQMQHRYTATIHWHSETSYLKKQLFHIFFFLFLFYLIKNRY